MQAISNIATQDGYAPALTLGPDPVAQQLIYVVANAAVFARFASQRSDLTAQPFGPEVLITPSTNTVQRVSGVQFRSAVAGVPARVVAQLVDPDDPQFGGGVPFSATLAASGGLTPGVAAVQVEKDGTLIGQEAAINFAGTTWTIADNGALGRIDVSPFAGAAPYAGNVFANFGQAYQMSLQSNQALYFSASGLEYLYLPVNGVLQTAGRIVASGNDVLRQSPGGLQRAEWGVISVAPGAPGATASFINAFTGFCTPVCTSNQNGIPIAIWPSSSFTTSVSFYHASGSAATAYWHAMGPG